LTDQEDDRLTAYVEELTGGPVVKLHRLARWRPAWFLDVQLDGRLLKLHARGDRRSDVLPFPSLEREAGILRVLEAGGVPVPHVHGLCPDPEAIVMDAVPGKRDVTSLPEAERLAVAEEHIALLARMHALDLAPFAALGIDVPSTPTELGLGMLEAYLPLYRRTKAAPEPLVEFAIRWAQRNVPQHRTRPAFVHWDAGQFLHEDGRITALYDFETCLVGDPLMDLAALRMRDPAEPLGADLTHLFRHYAKVSGEPVDVGALRFHTVVFALVGVMALAGPMVTPLPGSPHLEYLWWDLMQRRTLVWALAECVDVEVPPPDPVSPRPSAVGPLLRMLEDALEQLPAGVGYERYQRQSAALLARCATHADGVRPELDAQTAQEIGDLLGRDPVDLAAASQELEAFVAAAGPEHDTALVTLLHRQVERSVLSLEPVADRVAGYALARVVL
jgi:aminoglycoside phosphotransferase (APT) family kinase protein